VALPQGRFPGRLCQPAHAVRAQQRTVTPYPDPYIPDPLNSQPLNPEPLNPKLEDVEPKPYTLYPAPLHPYTLTPLHPEPYTLYPKP